MLLMAVVLAVVSTGIVRSAQTLELSRQHVRSVMCCREFMLHRPSCVAGNGYAGCEEAVRRLDVPIPQSNRVYTRIYAPVALR